MSEIEVTFEEMEMLRGYPGPLPPVAHSAAAAVMMLNHYRSVGGTPQQCHLAEQDLVKALNQLAWIEHCAAAKGVRSETFDYEKYHHDMNSEG